MTIRVQVIDNRTMLQTSLRVLLASEPDVELSEFYECSAGCAQDCLRDEPDVLILSLSEHGRCNLDCVERIPARSPGAQLIVLADHEDIVLAARALRLGVRGFVSKSSPGTALIEGVRAVARGENYVDPPVAQRMAAALLTGGDDPFATLTTREFEIFVMLAGGSSRREIADRLYLSVKTVSNHHSHIVKKLGVKNPAELTRLAFRHGVVG